jgi:hypothetical protein
MGYNNALNCIAVGNLLVSSVNFVSFNLNFAVKNSFATIMFHYQRVIIKQGENTQIVNIETLGNIIS